MTHKETLDKASAAHIRSGRAENNFGRIAALWSAYIGVQITPTDSAVMMSLLKDARIKDGYAVEDSFVDAAGYIACAAEIATSWPETAALKGGE